VRFLSDPPALVMAEDAWLSLAVSFLATPSVHFCAAVLRPLSADAHSCCAVELGIRGSALAVATSVVSFWQLADTVDGLVEDTAPGSAALRAATSALKAETTALLEATHFTVPTTLLATVLDVLADGWLVVVELVLVLVLEEHPAMATAAMITTSAAMRFLMVDLSRFGWSATRLR